jgi:hypothetical protein
MINGPWVFVGVWVCVALSCFRYTLDPKGHHQVTRASTIDHQESIGNYNQPQACKYLPWCYYYTIEANNMGGATMQPLNFTEQNLKDLEKLYSDSLTTMDSEEYNDIKARLQLIADIIEAPFGAFNSSH